MAVTKVEENTQQFWGKKSKRWELKFPHLVCVEVPDPDKLQGRDRTEAAQIRSKYFNLEGRLRYKDLKLTEEERIEMMDTDMNILMGVDRAEWQAYQDEKAGKAPPDKENTEDEIF